MLTDGFKTAIMSSVTSECDGHALEPYGAEAGPIAEALQEVADDAPSSLGIKVATGRKLVEAMHSGIEQTMAISTLMVPVALLIVAAMVGSFRLTLITAFNLTACLSSTIFIMCLVAMYIDVSMFVPALMMAVALAMSIDYSLFLLTRFQKELKAGHSVREAVVTMLATSGRIVLVSGVILFLCFASISAFPGDIILSMGLGASIAVLAAVLAALTFTPAALLTFPKFFCGQDCGEGFDSKACFQLLQGIF
jgi:uncharacterized membrane protein YdfJ with MMPL/SSD domain